jgi:hypothetical protein
MAKKKTLALEDVYLSRQAKNFQKDPNFGEEPPNAKMDETLIAKAVNELQASGGDCPIVALYNSANRVGVLVHISAEHAADGYHATLLDKLFATFDLPAESEVYILMDLQGLGKVEAERTSWLNQIRGVLEARGFSGIHTCTRAAGKNVTLNAASGTMVVNDDNGHELLAVDLAAG